MTDKLRLLIVSAVHPFPRNSGQQQRVYYTLRALREQFHITFLTVADVAQQGDVRKKLLEVCDEAIVLPSLYSSSMASRVLHKVIGTLYTAFTGLKFSNYLIGEVEFSTKRIISALGDAAFDGVLFEYWHAFKTVSLFRERGVTTLLDMHNILWQSFARQLDVRKFFPAWIKQWLVERYKAREESAWQNFDMLIAINQSEFDYVRQSLGERKKLFYLPMGTDVTLWPYCWTPAQSPRRVAYYASLGSAHNQQDALLCYREIMPLIWQTFPDVELWIVGSNPPAFVKDLERDSRVHVTGFVERPQDVLQTMSLVLCPWSGTYGFRSRVVEVMALGVPVVASADAVHGMGFRVGEGVFIFDTAAGMAGQSALLLADNPALQAQSRAARQQVEENFNYNATYGRFEQELSLFLSTGNPYVISKNQDSSTRL